MDGKRVDACFEGALLGGVQVSGCCGHGDRSRAYVRVEVRKPDSKPAASARPARHSSLNISWGCRNPSQMVNCSVNAYQYTGSYYANIYNGSGGVGGFTAPYNNPVDLFCHWNGQTVHVVAPWNGYYQCNFR